MSDISENMASIRFSRRQKIAGYRRTFMLGDGTPIEGQVFEEIIPVVDLSATGWYEADTGKEVTDPSLLTKLEELYKKNKS